MPQPLAPTAASTTVDVFFRFDDYSETSPVAVEAGFVDALQAHGMTATLAVVPAVTQGRFHDSAKREEQPLSPAKFAFLRGALAAGAIDIALHGWNHRSRTGRDPHSEFVGMPLDEQIVRVSSGARMLREGLSHSPTVFVPPWNRYDARTVEALAREGIACLSANRYGPLGSAAMLFAPITTDMSGMWEAIAQARRTAVTDAIVGVLLHPYDFNESGDTRATMSCVDFAGELARLADQSGVHVLSISDLVRTRHLGADRYRANRFESVEHVKPSFSRSPASGPVFLPTAVARRDKNRSLIQTISIHLAAAIVGAVTANIVATSKALLQVSFYSAAIALVALISSGVRSGAVTFRRMLVAAWMLGLVLWAAVRLAGALP